jgi:membrane-associated protein
MLASLLEWLRTHEGPAAYGVLGLASLIEYVFPPFPGDTIAVFGVCLAFAAGYDPAFVFLALVLGAIVGGQAMWALGRRLRDSDRRPMFLRGARATQALEQVARGFERWGGWFLVAHRFIPALRAFVFVGAGLAGMSFARVLVLGALSAALWNALLLAAGWLVTDQWERLAEGVSVYSAVVIGIAVVAGLIIWSRRRR